RATLLPRLRLGRGARGPPQRLPAGPPLPGAAVAARRLEAGPGGCRLRQQTTPPLRPRGPGHPRHRDPAEPPWARPEMAPDEVPAADGQAVPQEAARGPPPPRVWAKVASGIGVQPAQAPARELPRGSLGCRARARVPPPRTDSQPDAPCRLSIDGFNRASSGLTAPATSPRLLCAGAPRSPG